MAGHSEYKHTGVERDYGAQRGVRQGLVNRRYTHVGNSLRWEAIAVAYVAVILFIAVHSDHTTLSPRLSAEPYRLLLFIGLSCPFANRDVQTEDRKAARGWYSPATPQQSPVVIIDIL